MTPQLNATYLPALKGSVGRWAFYTTLMKFSEVAERIKLSDEIYQNKNLSDMVQRTVRSSRIAEIADYLSNDEERFFPAMVVAVFGGEPNWVDFSITSGDSQSGIDLSELDKSKLDAFGILVLKGNERLFPLDGQHRLAGIREALTLPGAKEKFLDDDEVAVMLVAHESSKEGRTRSRRLFTVLNKRAVPVKKHETIALDEDDVMAIATRYLVESFDPLTREDIVLFRTNANMPSNNDSAFTTIVTVYDMLYDLFRVVSRKSPEELKYHRPDSAWMNVYIACARKFFSNMMETFPEVKQCLSDDNPRAIIGRNRRVDGGHVLFRPVGQRLMAQTVAESIRSSFREKFGFGTRSALEATKQIDVTMQKAFQRFRTLPTDLTEPPYLNSIWEPGTCKMRVKRMAIVRDVILKQYGLIRSSVERRLDERIKSSVGSGSSIKDFLW